MTERTRNTVVGLTVLIAIVALGFLIVLFEGVPAGLSNTYTIHVELPHANGLTTGSRVMLSGVEIGSVQQIDFKPDPAHGVDIRCRINGEFNIPFNVSVQAIAGTLGGGGQIDIVALPDRPDPAQPRYQPRDGSARLAGQPTSLRLHLEKLADQLSNDIQYQLDRFGKMAEDVAELARQYTDVGQKVDALLQPRDLADVDAGQTPGNLHTAIARADVGLKQLTDLLNGANQIVNDPAFQSDIKSTVANTRKLTVAANQQLDQLTRRYIAVADDLSLAAAHINALLTDVRAGKGTVGKLMKQDNLYNSLDDAANRLSDVLRDFKLMLEKWSAEGISVQF